MLYIVELLAIVAVYTYKPEIGIWMNRKMTELVAWSRTQLGTRKDIP